jgi:NADH dehydrogenase
MSIKQVTVFGGSGFIGRAIVRALAHQGYLVRVAARRIELAEPVKTAGDVGQVMLMRANVRFPQSVAAAVAGSQAVVNAVGIPFQRGRQTYQAVHAEGARTIAQAASAAGVQRLIHISGIGADNRSSKNRYIQSKVAAEDAIVGAFDGATILRNSVVFGPGDVMFNRLADIARKAPLFPLIGNGAAKVQPVFVGDVGQAVAAALARPDTAKSVFELGGPRVYTYREVAQLVLHEIDRKKPIIGTPASVMKIAAFFAQQVAIVGLVPPLTVDQVELMVHDNVVRPGALGLGALDIQATAAEVILPTYLDRFRLGGRYNQHAPV